MLKINAKSTGVVKVDAGVKRYQAKVKKAHLTAMKVEGNRLRVDLKKQIQRGVVGGKKLKGLSLLQRTLGSTKRGGLRLNRPLRRLHIGVRYFVPSTRPNEVHVGWVGPQYSTFASRDGLARGYDYEPGWDKRISVSGSWRGLAKKHQEGFTEELTERRREYFAGWGAEISKSTFGGKKSRRRAVFFLRKETRRMRTPARPILEPFWASERGDARINIRVNFRRKLRGERI